ncbi:MAG: hypothetical protein NTW96_04040 [Planctomycetia bacterium]|nr:hypothetical protein [Planctomycetia bacterium]
MARDTQKQITDAAKQTAKEVATAQVDQNKRTIDILRQQEKEAVAAEKSKQAAAKETAREQAKALQQVKQSQQLAVHANKALEGALLGTLRGAMQLTKGFLLLGLAGEDNTKKLLQGFVKIQGAFTALHAGVTTIDKLIEGWTAYRAATEGAAVAQTKLAAAQAATGGGAIAGAAASGKGVAAAGIAGIGLSGASVTAGLVLAAEAVTITAAVVSIVTGKENFASNMGRKIGKGAAGLLFGDQKEEDTPWHKKPARAYWEPYIQETQSENKLARGQDRFTRGGKAFRDAREQALVESRTDIERRGMQNRFTAPTVAESVSRSAEARTSLYYARQGLATAGAESTGGVADRATLGQAQGKVEGAIEKTISALQEEIQSRLTYADTVKTANDKALEANKKHYDELETQYKAHAAKELELRTKTFNDMAGISLASPSKQQHVVRSIEATLAGTGTRKQASEAMQYLGPEERKKAEQQWIGKMSPHDRDVFERAGKGSLDTERKAKEADARGMGEAAAQGNQLQAAATASQQRLGEVIRQVTQQLYANEKELMDLRSALASVAHNQGQREKAMSQ